MKINSRDKGRRGQSEFANILRGRDWGVDDTRCGKHCEDIIAVDPDGVEWSVEVKKTKMITVDHRKQAREQAKARCLRWMLASHIHGTRSWLVQQQSRKPVVWSDY